MVSADNAHAVHPNRPEEADRSERPVPNGGVVIKYNANARYTTDSVSAAVFSEICRAAGVPVQRYSNRADKAGGSTLGNISLTHLSLESVDIGLAQLAMHSCYETAGAKDTEYLVRAMREFFSHSIRKTAEGVSL
jgi:aspartyl aminopeptidase